MLCAFTRDRNQILYEPGFFEQYTGPDGRVWTLSERSWLNVTASGADFRENNTGGCEGVSPDGEGLDACVCGAYYLRHGLGFQDGEGVMVTLGAKAGAPCGWR